MTPKHYESNNFDVIDICKAYNLNFNLGNVVKYICRLGKKDSPLQELEKAKDYINREIEHLKKIKKL